MGLVQPHSQRVSPPTVGVQLVCESLPPNRFDGCDGRTDIRATLQTKDGHETGTSAANNSLKWTTEIIAKTAADGSLDFSGPAVHGKRGERFFYLSWSGERAGQRAMFRRMKIHLRTVTEAQIAYAAKSGGTLVARVHAVAKDGGPACASVPLLGDGWKVESRNS